MRECVRLRIFSKNWSSRLSDLSYARRHLALVSNMSSRGQISPHRDLDTHELHVMDSTEHVFCYLKHIPRTPECSESYVHQREEDDGVQPLSHVFVYQSF